jgi:hypothetical protein
MLDYTTINILMQSQDLVFNNGTLQIHVCTNSEQTVCYIYVHDVLNDCLTMRYFVDIETALGWIDTL